MSITAEARTQDSYIKSVILYQLSYGDVIFYCYFKVTIYLSQSGVKVKLLTDSISADGISYITPVIVTIKTISQDALSKFSNRDFIGIKWYFILYASNLSFKILILVPLFAFPCFLNISLRELLVFTKCCNNSFSYI